MVSKNFHLKATKEDVERLESVRKRFGLLAYGDTIRLCIKKVSDEGTA